MSDYNLVVSGTRLAERFSAVESAPGEAADVAGPPDLAAFLGASQESLETAAGTAESAAPELSDLEKASMLMRFNAAVQSLKEADLTPGVFSTTENQIAALLQSALAERAAQSGQVEPAPADGREAKYDERDVRWALSLVTWIGKLNPHDWLPFPREPESVGGDMMFAVVGDWGTGLYGAPKCAASIQTAGGFEYIVHLGDVYYSGTTREMKSNFLETWPRVAGARNRACNGNHEMYSGGYGYFDVVLPRFGQSSSCFAVRNPDWLIVGLDSAYDDHDLASNQNAWLKQLIDGSDRRKVVIFTHHQPFSHFDRGGEKLIEKLLPLLDGKRITAWYWGHEHRCVVYDRHPRWGFHGRCIGHSGYPYFRKPSLEFRQVADPPPRSYAFWRELPANAQSGAPRAILLDGPNPHLDRHKDKYGPNGYLTLEFTGPKLTERYFLATGEELTRIELS